MANQLRPSLLLILLGGLLPSLLSGQSPSSTPPRHTSSRASVVYTSQQYGFRFDLPQSWKGYTVLTQQWEGTPDDPARQNQKEHGPELILRDPRWTKAQPRQDIPIMIFTLKQWNENLVVSAAPMGPSELARNSRYVFALPPRYNYAFPDGYQEVEKIIADKPLHPF